MVYQYSKQQHVKYSNISSINEINHQYYDIFKNSYHSRLYYYKHLFTYIINSHITINLYHSFTSNLLIHTIHKQILFYLHSIQTLIHHKITFFTSSASEIFLFFANSSFILWRAAVKNTLANITFSTAIKGKVKETAIKKYTHRIHCTSIYCDMENMLLNIKLMP